ncbi:MAG: aspartate aminotransferase family protein [Lachnospiraceae bacterium]|jgi:acetylornithine/N-succinyldiaminopimelate aminotransferase|nr:aspartate aminotransferase family protein [Lachnospiraceae bacterium]
MNKYIEETEQNLIKTYNPAQIVLEKGDGAYLYDVDGKKYLDFAAGYAVCGLGYNNEEFNNSLKAQIDELIHTSNLYYNTTRGEAAKALKDISGMDGVFFTNSGTEANEGALKMARAYHYRKGNKKTEFISFNNSFHGRTFGALSVTGTKEYQEPFEPMLPTVKFAEFNNLQSVKELINDNTCGIIVEPLQGEGGINLANKDFLAGLKDICHANDILLIFDEIQCGMGRSGEFFTWQTFGIKPDIMTVAKAIGNGVPIGAFLGTEKVISNSLKPGDHGTTYGGNPLCCKAVVTTIDLYKKLNILDNVKVVGKYLEEKLNELKKENNKVVAVKGTGLMEGIELSVPVSDVIAKANENGLLLISAKGNVIRFVPPLIITKEQVDEMIGILKGCI